MKNITQSLKIAALALALSIGISYVSAWTAPTVTPPNGNVAAPINVSSTAQTKTGDLTVNKITAPTSCIGADCRTAWPSGGDNLGNHTATQALSMGGNNINNAGTIAATGGIDVGNAGGTYAYVTLRDDESPNGVKYIHANSNVVGFLSGAGGWLSYWANNGDSYQTGNGNVNDMYIRASGKWASQAGGDSPAGTLCGSFVNDTMWGTGWSAFAQCQGLNGWSGCPSGYTFRATSYDQYNGSANYFYSCVKN